MKIAFVVEGATEVAFKDAVRKFLKERLLEEQMPKLHFIPQGGRIPKEETLKKLVDNLCLTHDAVIVLTDVYTGTNDFTNANDAKHKMRNWVGANPKFHPHAAQHDFEAWLLPYWDTIRRLAKTNRNAPSGSPEAVNHNKPPAYHIKEVFEAGDSRDSYSKPRDAARILRENNLSVAANACPELMSFLNTILQLSGGQLLGQ